MRCFLDTEFLEDGQTIELISIAIVSDEGDSYYAVVSDADWQRILQDGWVKQHVIPQLPKMGSAEWKPRAQIAQEIVQFVGPNPTFVSDFAAYDWVVLCQLYGKMINLPDTWPMWCEDVQQLKNLAGIEQFPMMDSNEHNALADARETHARYHQCLAALKRKGIDLDPLPQVKKFQRNQQAR